jgi:putative SOS response-associated peptidase YedK
MCYSAQVVQDLKKLFRELNVFMDHEEAERIFLLRLDDPTVNISKGFEANFDNPANESERRIKAAIDEHRSRAAGKFEKELFTQKTRLVNAERSLKTKETKKAREDVRIATTKIETFSTKLSSLRSTELTLDDRRVFPMVYGGVIVKRDGKNWLTPMRYFCRPAGKPAFYDRKFPGLYNARRDNLEKFWSEQFGRTHAIAVVDSFFEWVKAHSKEGRELAPGEAERSIELQFKPNPPRSMLVACLWSHWTDPQLPYINGFAAITDDPPPEVAAAGHDRCVINIKPENVNAWLTPEGRSRAELQAILTDRETPTYENEEVLAA